MSTVINDADRMAVHSGHTGCAHGKRQRKPDAVATWLIHKQCAFMGCGSTVGDNKAEPDSTLVITQRGVSRIEGEGTAVKDCLRIVTVTLNRKIQPAGTDC